METPESFIDVDVELRLASSHGNLQAIVKLIGAGANVNAKSSLGQTALILACQKAPRESKLCVIRHLLQEGADVNASNITGSSALIEASRNGDEDVVSLLIGHPNRDLNHFDSCGDTALLVASEEKHFNIVALLVKNGADVHLRNWLGFCALHHVFLGCNFQIFRLLLDYGADPNCSFRDGSRLLHAAVLNDDFVGLRNLLNLPPVFKNPCSSRWGSPLTLACRSGSIECMQELLHNGIETQREDSQLATALYCAVQKGHADLVGLLLDRVHQIPHRQRGRDLRAVLSYVLDNRSGRNDGGRYFELACRNCSFKFVQEVLENENVPHTRAAFIAACRRGDLDIVKLLLKFGAIADREGFLAALDKENLPLAKHLASLGCANLGGNSGRTPLIEMSSDGSIDHVKLLLQIGVDVNAQDDDGRSAIIAATESGHSRIIQLLAHNGADLDLADVNGRTALLIACKRMDLDSVLVLMQHNVQSGARDADHNTALILACRKNQVDLAKLLICPASINLQNNERDTALIISCRKGNLALVSLLIKQGANINVHGRDGETPLIAACSSASNAILVEFLIHHGADISAISAGGENAVARAKALGHQHIASLLQSNTVTPRKANKSALMLLCQSEHFSLETAEEVLRHNGNINEIDERGNSALLNNCIAGHLGGFEFLLRNDAALDLKNKQGENALMIIIRKRRLQHFKPFMEAVSCRSEAAQADILNMQDNEGMTALMLAILYRFQHGFMELIRKGVDINMTNKCSQTAIHLACSGSYKDYLMQLLKLKCHLNRRDILGDTPLISACKVSQIGTMECLLEYGAAIGVADLRNETPLHIACRNEQLEIVKLLLRYKHPIDVRNAKGETPLYIASSKVKHEIVALLVEMGADVNIADIHGQTPLMMARKFYRLESSRLLLDHGAVIDHSSLTGCTALMISCEFDSRDINTLFIQGCTNLNQKDQDGRTALMFAASQQVSSRLTLVESLLQNGADIHTKDQNGYTALHFAASSSRESLNTFEVLLLLLSRGADQELQDSCRRALVQKALHHHLPTEVKLRDLIHDYGGENPLTLACTIHEPSALAMILAGANINELSHCGRTPLIAACQSKFEEVVIVLLEQRCEVLAEDNSKSTALMYAVECCSLAVVEKFFLLDHVDQNIAQARDGRENSLLMRACSQGRFETVKFLMDQSLVPTGTFNKDGLNASLVACSSEVSGSLKCLILCIFQEYDQVLRNRSKALRLAESSKQPDKLKVLYFMLVEQVMQLGEDCIRLILDFWGLDS